MLMRLENIEKTYRNQKHPVIQNVNLIVEKGKTTGILGKSGSGKSTIGQIMAGILKPSEGTVFFQDQALSYPFPKEVRQKIQILFQHPEISFNPRMSLLESMKEPYRFRKTLFSMEILLEELEKFGIYEEHLKRDPSSLSGGELQRLALARIMLMQPEFLVLDEPTSMLDVISQAQVILLLEKLQRERNLGYLFISHDYELCRHFCHRIYYLKDGRLKEGGEECNDE
ncbi:ABC transporter ATP-binding protein [Parablautia sp. Marseille-Q6255]|uniref:ABC transporter ATP-binding protein n=1 Tax=Parablautia sp. Marseille-Q6255 TaxID=3039593 RepID=UPI002F404B01